jgi:hypothetical protein
MTRAEEGSSPGPSSHGDDPMGRQMMDSFFAVFLLPRHCFPSIQNQKVREKQIPASWDRYN